MKKTFVQFLIFFSLLFTFLPNEVETTIPTAETIEYVQPTSNSPSGLKEPR